MATQKQPAAKSSKPANALQLYTRQWKQKAIDFVSQFEKFKTIVQNNYDLGREHLRRGNTQDAVLRFRFVLWLDPVFKDSWYWLGCSYLADGKLKPAKDALLKSLKQNPASTEARYMLALVMGKAMPKGELPRVLPRALIQEQFDVQAENYNNLQIGELGYEGHTLLCNAIRSCIQPGRVDAVTLELGTGTGLCGPLVRDYTHHLTGVDLSERMLEEAGKLYDARSNKIYDALIARDMAEFLADGPDASYDVIFAANSLGFVGDLTPIFEHTARLLKPGGLFAFTVDSMETGAYQFDPEIGRFRYSAPTIADLAARFGLTEERSRQAAVYPESAGLLRVYVKR